MNLMMEKHSQMLVEEEKRHRQKSQILSSILKEQIRLR